MAGKEGSKYYDIFLDYSIFLKYKNDEVPVLTPEHFNLLLQIEELGSISSSAKELGISYRKAWELIKQAEERLGFSLVFKHRGGRSGGMTELTDDGRRLAASYRQLRLEFNESVKRVVKDFFSHINV
ncbi:MAG: LysR family transcriptional regulator [Bacteroidales bacterium]|nr:LysR family transcriptional regulator [Bacteroidales bacterium]HPD94937.1 LysR family transcriptional regulator [Tenuifilaceae bacterium]HRX31326.1 LysR family transcriptional regulator [Tenuifilaceae bacterium]